MKFLLLSLLLPSAWAQRGLDTTDKIHSMDFKDNVYTVKFWSNPKVYRLNKADKVVPCLEDAFKAKQDVMLKVDPHHGELLACKLAPGSLPGAR